MPLVPTGELVEAAGAEGHGVAAFNVITLEHAEGIVAGAEAVGAPVILQISENAVRYHGGKLLPIASATVALARQAEVSVAVHLDHIEDSELLYRAPEAGVSSVMFDASKLAYAANLAATRKAADWAHDHGLWLEAELGEVGGKDGAHGPGVRTDPVAATEFVAATGVDALAVAVGSSHAMTSRTAELDHELIATLREVVPVPLVLHGSSGVPDDQLRRAVAAGIVKVNIGTGLNVAFTRGVREFLAAHADVSDPRKYLAPGRAELAAVVRTMLEVVAVKQS